MKTPPLAPTLWRTCRVLACPRRLAALEVVIGKGPICVKQLAHLCRMPENTATQYLRALQARGLLAARRQSRWVYYVAQADRSVQHAESMLAAMQDAFTGGVTVAEMVRDLTAFTHARRIDIVRRLAMRPAIAEQIAHDTLMSVPACYRHLTKLQARGVVVETRDSKFELGTLRRRLAVQLLHAALE